LTFYLCLDSLRVCVKYALYWWFLLFLANSFSELTFRVFFDHFMYVNSYVGSFFNFLYFLYSYLAYFLSILSVWTQILGLFWLLVLFLLCLSVRETCLVLVISYIWCFLWFRTSSLSLFWYIYVLSPYLGSVLTLIECSWNITCFSDFFYLNCVRLLSPYLKSLLTNLCFWTHILSLFWKVVVFWLFLSVQKNPCYFCDIF
jgi:hypothetical protein